jgi:hypothetical protein
LHKLFELSRTAAIEVRDQFDLRVDLEMPIHGLDVIDRCMWRDPQLSGDLFSTVPFQQNE